MTMQDMGHTTLETWKRCLVKYWRSSWKESMSLDTKRATGMEYDLTCSLKLHSWSTGKVLEELWELHCSQTWSRSGPIDFTLPHRYWKISTIWEKKQDQSHKNFIKKKQKWEEKAIKMIKLASERFWKSALIPFREISKVLSTYIQDMLPIKRWMFTTPSRLDRSSNQSSRQACQMDFIHLLWIKSWPRNQARNLSRLEKSNFLIQK